MKSKFIVLLVLISSTFFCKKEENVNQEQVNSNQTISQTPKPERPKPSGPVSYINAKSGLTLRELPDRTSKKIILIPYMEEVYTIEETDVKETIEDKEDIWIKVEYRSSTDTYVGFLFKGFLTSEMATDTPKGFFKRGNCKSPETKLPKDALLCIGRCNQFDYEMLYDSRSLVFFENGNVSCWLMREHLPGEQIAVVRKDSCQYKIIDSDTLAIFSSNKTYEIKFQDSDWQWDRSDSFFIGLSGSCFR